MVILVFSALGGYGQQVSKGIKFFKGSWAEALAKSKAENKMIFMDCSIRSCIPCREMEANVFPQEKVGGFYNENYINVAMGMDEGEGKELSSYYGVGSFPAMLYFKPGGFLVAHEQGKRDAEELLADGNKNLQLKDTITLEERFEKGGYQDPIFLQRYFKEVMENEPLGAEQHAFDKIIKFKGADVLLEKKYWEALGIASPGSAAALYFVKNHLKFAKIYGENAVNAKIMAIYFNNRFLIWYGDDHLNNKPSYENFKKRMEERGVPDLSFMKMAVDFHQRCRDFKYDEAFAIADPFMKSAKWWQYYRMALHADWLTAGRPLERKKVMVWANKALQLAKTAQERKESQELIDDLRNPFTNLILTPVVYGSNI